MEKHCLICYQTLSSGDWEIKREAREESVIRKQLEVIFVLRELLRLPVYKVKGFLEQAEGDNLDKWINFCGNCEDEVERARGIFEELVSVNGRFKGVRDKLVGMVRGSWGKEQGSKLGRGGRRTRGRSLKKEEGITEATRQFVVKYDYSSDPDPFMEIRCRLLSVKQEPEEPRDEEDNVDLDAFVNELINEEDDDRGEMEEEEEVAPSKSLFVGEGSSDSDWEPQDKDSDFEVDEDEVEEDNLLEKEAVKEINSLVKGSDADKPSSSSATCSTVIPEKRTTQPRGKYRKRGSSALEDEGAFLVNGQIRYKCIVEDCGMILKSRRNYMRHKVRRHSGKQKELQHEAAFRTETGEIHYRCPVEDCGMILKDKAKYKRHKLHVHDGVPRPKRKLNLCCEKCGKVYASYAGLHWHRRVIHENSSIKRPRNHSEAAMKRYTEKIQCAHCPRMVTRRVMNHHVRMLHSEGFSFYCQNCGQGFKDKSDFKCHQADKHGICSWQDCGVRVLEGREELWKHQVEVHGKEVDIFRCQDCGKYFTNKTRLNRHLKIHEYQRRVQEGGVGQVGGRSEWVCDLCGKEFALSEYLYFHKWSTHKIRNNTQIKI